MNPDQPSREQIEARLTALLLGELPAAEAELLRWSIEHDPELKKLHDQLKLTIGFVREAMKNPAGAPVEKETPLKMSAERRQKLLAHFKTDRPKPLVPPLRRKTSPLIPTLVVIAIAALLAAVLLPVQYASKTKSLHMIGNLSGLPSIGKGAYGTLGSDERASIDNTRRIPAPSGIYAERQAEQSLKPAATPNPQQPVATPPMAQIVLPKTESEQDTGAAYARNTFNADFNPGVSAITPVQSEPNSAPVVVTGIPPAPASAPEPIAETVAEMSSPPPASATSPQTEGKIPPTVAGGNYTLSAAGPNSTPFANRLESVEGLFSFSGEKAAKNNNRSYGGGAGGGGGGGDFGAGGISSNAYANNTFGPSGQAGLGSGAVSFGGTINGTPHLAPSDNFITTNAIAEKQGVFYRFGNNSAGEDEVAYNDNEKDHKQVGVTPISGSAASLQSQQQNVQVERAWQAPPVSIHQVNKALISPPANAPIPQPEIQTRDNAFSTFSLNVSDVSFKLAQASLANGQMPNPDSIRSEEFINAFDYRDPEPLQGQPLAFTSERARDPFAQERDVLRFSIKAAALGRQEGRALNLVLLLDTSGSMERADRVAIIREALRVLSAQLQPQDTVSVVTFARTARLWADGVPGGLAGITLEKVGSITPEGGTNLEEAMRLAYATARRHFIANGMNRVVLLTDGAANLGNVDPQTLTHKVEAERRKGIALDCFGIGWEDYNDDMLEQLSSNGDGRYAFINSPDEAGTEFAAKLAGALQVAAEDVKVQVEFNPDRVTAWRQIGYAKHQLTKQQFRDNTVAAGTIAAREAGNALYVIEAKPDGQGPIATVRVRYRVPGTQDNRERSWLVDYTGTAPALAQASPAMRLAVTGAEFSEWLSDSPYAQNVTPDDLLNYLSGIPQIYGADEHPKQLEWMIRQAKSVSGK